MLASPVSFSRGFVVAVAFFFIFIKSLNGLESPRDSNAVGNQLFILFNYILRFRSPYDTLLIK